MSSTLTIGGKTVQDITIGAKQVQSIYDNTHQVLLWERVEPNYFYFEDRSGADNSISITKTGDQAEWLALEYSNDKETWNTWDFSQVLTLPANGKVYLRGDNTYGFGFNNANYHTLNCTGNYAVGGDVWSVMSENVSIILGRFMTRTFQNSATLVDCSQLSIPNMPMDSVAFTWAFANCPNLVSVMESIPATYYYDESGTDNSQFYMMFIENASQTNFPVFPNITYLKNAGMRQILGFGSTPYNQALEYVDLSNIETVYKQALDYAFYKCEALEVVKIGISEWGVFEDEDNTSDYYNNTHFWLVNTHSTGVFCKNSTLPVTRGNNYIPTNWSIADLNGKLYAPVITNNNNTITIAEAEGGASCQIFYTVDGTTPTPDNGTLYTQPFTVGSGVTVKAISHYNGNRADLITDSDYVETTTGAMKISGYPFGEPYEEGHSLSNDVQYFCVGTPDGGEHYYLMRNSNWSEDVYNSQTSYYDQGTPVTVGTDKNGNKYIAADSITNPNLYSRTLSAGDTSGNIEKHYYGNLQLNSDEGFDSGTRLWNDPDAFSEYNKGKWQISDQGASWYSGYRMKYGEVTHGTNNLGNCFHLSTDTTNDYSIMFFKAVSQVIYINN